ncbi:MAG TPA: hypothetical protein VFF30_19385 [Nitrososphaerales archaeon]|nr:hypothetical protein [Nitrososphaerales archaeon]
MAIQKTSALLVSAVVVGLVVGAAIGLVISPAVMPIRGTVASTVTNTQVVTDWQTIVALQSVTKTITESGYNKYCCNDSGLNSSTSCETALSPGYLPMLRLRYLVETNPSFIAAENGSLFTYETEGCGTSQTQVEVDFSFFHTTDTLFLTPCDNYQNFTYYLSVFIPLTRNGYNLTSMTIQSGNSSDYLMGCTTSMSVTSNTTGS